MLGINAISESPLKNNWIRGYGSSSTRSGTNSQEPGNFFSSNRRGSLTAGYSKGCDAYPVDVKPKFQLDAKPTLIPLPNISDMPIKGLVGPYNKSEVILLTKPKRLSIVEQNKYVRDTFKIFYNEMQSLVPELTLKPSSKNLKCTGSFTYDFCTCTFQAQVWHVEGHEEKNTYIFEFRRKTQNARDAFRYLFRRVASILKKAGRAEKYGNGLEIYANPPETTPGDLGELALPSFGGAESPLRMSPVLDDLGALAMPSFGGIGSHTRMASLTDADDFSIDLAADDQINNWVRFISECKAPLCEETLRIIARCCINSNNRRVLANNSEMQKAVVEMLKRSKDSTTCYNALTIINAVFEENPPAGCFVDDRILLAVAQVLKSHSGVKRRSKDAPKISRSVAVVRVALKALIVLSECAECYDERDIRAVLKELVEEGPLKLKDDSSQEQLDYVIRNLKKHPRRNDTAC